MKVAFITQWFPPEKGSAALPGVIAAALQARGVDVRVVTAFPNYPEGTLQEGWRQSFGHRERRGEVTVLRTPIYISHDDRAWPRMLNYVSFAASATWTLLRHGRDVETVWVHGTPATAAIPAMILKAVAGTPYVLHIQDLWPDTVLASGMLPRVVAKAVSPPLEWFCRLSYRQAAAIGVITPGMRTALTSRGVPEKKILDIPNWADEIVFFPGFDGSAVRNELGLSPTFTAMYAGSVGEVQGLETVVRAAALLKERTNIHFAIVGDGVAKSSLQELATDLDLKNITFIPPQPLERMSAVLAAADIQIISLKDLPLYRITLPSKVQATLAAGRPVIVSAGGDAGDVVSDADAGIAVEPGDPEALAHAVATAAAAPPAELDAWGRAGRRHYESRFSERQGVDRMISALARAISARKVQS